MAKQIDWDSQLGRRLKLRDLHVFFTVANCGSMGKAAARLGVTTSTVSEVIADLEHAVGVKLFDRNTHGVEPTIYGDALLKRGLIAFDELKQGIRDIQFLADPMVGELRIGCSESIAAATLPLIIQRFTEQHPGALLDVEGFELRTYVQKLRQRTLDLILTRRGQPDQEYDPHQELNVDTLYLDEIVVAASRTSRWTSRKKIDLAELAGERWISTPPGTWPYNLLAEAFRARGLPMPRMSVTTMSVHLPNSLLSLGPFIAIFPRSVLHVHGERFGLTALPLDLPIRPMPVVLLTLKNRTLSPVVQRFIECAHAVVKPFAGARRIRKV